MELRRLKLEGPPNRSLVSLAAIYRVSFQGHSQLVGTGFWITDKGHLVTAWHVVDDNIGEDGIDRGPIYAAQILSDGTVIARAFRKSSRSKTIDIAVSETYDFGGRDTVPVTMTLLEPKVGEPITTYSFMSPAEHIPPEELLHRKTETFHGSAYIPFLNIAYGLSFKTMEIAGEIEAVYPEGRDTVMMPFPCFQTNLTLRGANSGGPLFDRHGRVCGINCSGFAGAPVSYHAPIGAVLRLGARDIEIIPEDPVPRFRDVFQLGLFNRVLFDPPLEAILLSWPQRLFLRASRLIESFTESVRKRLRR